MKESLAYAALLASLVVGGTPFVCAQNHEPTTKNSAEREVRKVNVES